MKTPFACSLALFFFISTALCTAQTLYYNVFKGDNRIGLMKVERTEDGSQGVRYKIETEVTFRVFKEFKVESTFESIFQTGQLTYGKTLNLLNGNERESSRVIWNGSEYICERESKQKVLKQPIGYTIVQLYFEEPLTQDSVFSERFISPCFVEKAKSPHQYLIHLPDGKNNLYTYQNGVCTEVKVDLFLATIYFKLSDRDINTGTE